MKALTLHAPWAHAVAWLGKDIENRTWRPGVATIGTRIAIHAGVTEHDAEWSLIDKITDSCGVFTNVSVGAIVATAIVGEPVTRSTSPWFVGPIGWPLIDVRRLDKPIPMKGRLGLWTLPEGVIL